MSRALRVAVLAVIAIGCAVALWQYGRIPQPATYHAFADTRMLLRIPNALNVLSNVPFLFVGLAGLRRHNG
jgi:hypothetical protein